MSKRNYVIKVDADADKAQGELKEVGKDIEKLTATAKKAAKAEELGARARDKASKSVDRFTSSSKKAASVQTKVASSGQTAALSLKDVAFQAGMGGVAAASMTASFTEAVKKLDGMNEMAGQLGASAGRVAGSLMSMGVVAGGITLAMEGLQYVIGGVIDHFNALNAIKMSDELKEFGEYYGVDAARENEKANLETYRKALEDLRKRINIEAYDALVKKYGSEYKLLLHIQKIGIESFAKELEELGKTNVELVDKATNKIANVMTGAVNVATLGGAESTGIIKTKQSEMESLLSGFDADMAIKAHDASNESYKTSIKLQARTVEGLREAAAATKDLVGLEKLLTIAKQERNKAEESRKKDEYTALIEELNKKKAELKKPSATKAPAVKRGSDATNEKLRLEQQLDRDLEALHDRAAKRTMTQEKYLSNKIEEEYNQRLETAKKFGIDTEKVEEWHNLRIAEARIDFEKKMTSEVEKLEDDRLKKSMSTVEYETMQLEKEFGIRLQAAKDLGMDLLNVQKWYEAEKRAIEDKEKEKQDKKDEDEKKKKAAAWVKYSKMAYYSLKSAAKAYQEAKEWEIQLEEQYGHKIEKAQELRLISTLARFAEEAQGKLESVAEQEAALALAFALGGQAIDAVKHGITAGVLGGSSIAAGVAANALRNREKALRKQAEQQLKEAQAADEAAKSDADGVEREERPSKGGYGGGDRARRAPTTVNIKQEINVITYGAVGVDEFETIVIKAVNSGIRRNLVALPG